MLLTLVGALAVVLVAAGCKQATPVSDTAPSFAGTAAASDQTYPVGEAISPLTLPEASGGNGALVYSLEPMVPGLVFDTGTRTLSGTPTTSGAYEMTYQVQDADANTAAGDADTLSFTITITVREPEPGDTAPGFAATVADQTYVVGEAIRPLVLPEASGGDGHLTYSLGHMVPGLAFDQRTRTLSGTPTRGGSYAMEYKVEDSDGNTDASDTDTLTFTVTVQVPANAGFEWRVEAGVDKAVAALGVSGSGVIVAILDRGIDWESNDFRDDDGTTRIAYIFDLSDDAGAAEPGNGYGRGTIYTRQQIDHALDTGATLATRDAVGHGTTSTGIAAGNGRNSAARKYRGVAPNATIIAVKVVAGEGSDEPDFYDYAALPLAIDFVVDKARELSLPVVILLNLGSIGGPTDGTSALSRKIDQSVGPGHPGVVFVTGTGDDGIPSKTQNRAAGDVPDGGTRDLRFSLDRGTGDLEVWYDQTQGFAVSIETPMGTLGPYPPSQFEATGTGVQLFHYRGGDDFYGAENGKRLLSIRFHGTAGAGEYSLKLDHVAGPTGSSVQFDASLNTPLGESGRFLNFVTPGSIWDGAAAFRNVAPNSYVVRTNWTDIDGIERRLIGEGDVGELWTGSSVGPTVDGRIGVDVSAPGDRIVTTYAPGSYWASFRSNLIADGDGLYGMAGAVSAAAPVVAGIIALMLEVDPTLDADSVKRILQETARSDEFTGQTPNALWGYGKVDAFEALMAVSPRF